MAVPGAMPAAGGCPPATPPVQAAQTSPPGRHPEVPDYTDDAKKMSTAYKTLGLSWSTGEKKTTAKKFRMTLCNASDQIRFPMMKLSQLSCEAIDCLVWLVCGIGPLTKPSDFGCANKRECRLQARDQFQRFLRTQPGRLDGLTDAFDNVIEVAMRNGYSVDWLAPETRRLYCDKRNRGAGERATLKFCLRGSSPFIHPPTLPPYTHHPPTPTHPEKRVRKFVFNVIWLP